MPITLQREAPPSDPSMLIGFDGDRVNVRLDIDGRLTCRGQMILPEVTNAAFHKAASQVFGRQWQAPLGVVFDIRRPDRWRNEDREPPANILKWVAWVAGMDEPRMIGAHCVALALDPEGAMIGSARDASEEVC